MNARPTSRLSVIGCRLSVRPSEPTTDNRQRFVVAALLLALALIAPEASACPVCYGSPGDPLVKGANNGIAVLLGIVALVQIGFVALFISFWRRARALQRRREQFHLIEGGAR